MSSIDRVGLGGADAADRQEIRPLPLGISLSLICGLSVLLWVGMGRLVGLILFG